MAVIGTAAATAIERRGEEIMSKAEVVEKAAPHPAATETGRPDPAWVRGRCPECGDDLVSNLYYIGGKGYLVRWECWSSIQENPTCSYRKVL